MSAYSHLTKPSCFRVYEGRYNLRRTFIVVKHAQQDQLKLANMVFLLSLFMPQITGPLQVRSNLMRRFFPVQGEADADAQRFGHLNAGQVCGSLPAPGQIWKKRSPKMWVAFQSALFAICGDLPHLFSGFVVHFHFNQHKLEFLPVQVWPRFQSRCFSG